MKKLLRPFKVGEDVGLFLVNFERTCEKLSFAPETWPQRLLTLLPCEAAEVVARLSARDADDYDKVKSSLSKRYRLSAEAFRQRFRNASKKSSEGYLEFAYGLKTNLIEWLKSEEVYKSRDKVVECVCLEQFFRSIPQSVKLWVQDRVGVDSVERAAELAEEYATRRKLSGEESEPGRSNQRKTFRQGNGSRENGPEKPEAGQKWMQLRQSAKPRPAPSRGAQGEMMLELHDIVGRLEQWQTGKAVILRGDGGFFSSGGNLVTMRAIGTSEEGLQMAHLMQDTLVRFSKLRMLTVALVEGRALGGGAELTAVPDFRLLTPDAQVQFVHLRMGILPAWGGVTWLTRLVGPQLALDLITTGRVLGGEEAVRTGFASALLEGKDPLTEAVTWLQERLKPPIRLVRDAKAAVLAARDLPFADALRKEAQLFAPLWGGDHNKEALACNIKH
ncbi:hypothetical protein HPB47_005107 [Ixodes persulcatus]|uniref:Uncharacterized protein n=1 Tax=Ixodes persulcatus TaxID=34615 RepID=A0AC60PEN3_IXOPE|nr:hypothetical protein HPB47_005107 [Ixodes persulcatus]